MKNFKVEYNIYNLATITTEVESNSEYTEAETKEEAIANVIQYLHDQAVDNGYKSEIKEDKLVFENEEFFNFTATEEKTGGKIMRIKLKKAIKEVNLTLTQREHIINNLPQSVVDKLTSKELSELMMAMHKHYHEGKAESEKEISQHIGVPQGKTIWTVQL